LWARHRRTVHHQAELDFMKEILGEPTQEVGGAR